MNVLEVFYSIQGEGKYIGKPVIFVRTAGCSLKCPFCDTADSWMFPDDNGVNIKHLLPDIMRASNTCKTVVITGGEPTEQRDLYQIAEELKFNGYDVHLETNGTNDVIRGYFTHVVCSPKPGTGFRVAKGADELKYIISAKEPDFKLEKMIPANIRDQFRGRIWLQPMDEKDPEQLERNTKKCLEMALKDPRLRVGIQLHKVYGVQ